MGRRGGSRVSLWKAKSERGLSIVLGRVVAEAGLTEFEHPHSFCNQSPGGLPSDPTSHAGTLEHQEGAHRSPCRKRPRSFPGGSLWPFWSLTGMGGNS